MLYGKSERSLWQIDLIKYATSVDMIDCGYPAMFILRSQMTCH
jgi:hypothetical protein